MAFHKYTARWYASTSNLCEGALEATYEKNEATPLPTYDEMKEKIFSKLIENKFHFINVAPHKANCAIRIFRKEMEIDGKPAGLCGAVCFVKEPFGKWTTIDKKGNEIEMDFSDAYEVEYWTSAITLYSKKPVRADYYDVYLKVTSF